VAPTVVPATEPAAELAAPPDEAPAPTVSEPTGESLDETQPDYMDASLAPEVRARSLLERMTLEEKIGQMTLVEKGSLPHMDVTRHFIGGVLSGGGGSPSPNTTEAWAAMVDEFQKAALATRLAIPIIYGVDAVHGHGNLKGAVIFPHSIGLGATGDADLVERVARATAAEMIATNIRWNYAPVIAVPQDIRWGRTYEGFSENTELVTRLGLAYQAGLQGTSLSDPMSVLATPKHFIGDGAPSGALRQIRHGRSTRVICRSMRPNCATCICRLTRLLSMLGRSRSWCRSAVGTEKRCTGSSIC
jgi:hypothetical protein